MKIDFASGIYGAAIAARNGLYERGWLRARRLQGPVVSVGNISAGGSGKTPFVILLGELLRARGIPFDVLSRGYGRKTSGVLEVDPAGLPQEFGDEPLLIARRLRVPVVVGEDRYEAGRFAEERYGPQMHLLDDGFQHRGLARDFDFVLVTPEDARDRLLPAGRLREPMTSLRRADRQCGECGAGLWQRMFRSGRWCSAGLRGLRILFCSCGRRGWTRWRKRFFAITIRTGKKTFATYSNCGSAARQAGL
jgi:tetraacyldisaccharide 4'-kinase